jgi:heme A synthase
LNKGKKNPQQPSPPPSSLPPNKIKFPSLSIFAVIFFLLGLIYSIMLIGVYITSSHQGLSCMTWPLCPNGFNPPPPKYFYEHVHRFLVLILTIILISFTFFCIKKIPYKNIKNKLIIASILLITQISLGWLVIFTKLHPIVVATHLSNAVALFGIILITLLSVYNEFKKEKKPSNINKN